MVVHNVRTAGEFKAAIAENPKVIVDCFATWCGPCKAIAPKLAELSEDDAVKGKVHFIKLDVDEVPDVAKDLGIRAMPTFLLFENGDKSDELVGANPTALIQKVKTFAS
jgi:thioredoxin 1